MSRRFSCFWLFLGTLLFAVAEQAQACTFCFGDLNSDSARSVKMAILFLLGVVVFVLGMIASVILRCIVRARKIQNQN